MHRNDGLKILVSSASYSTDNGQGVFCVNLCERLAERQIEVAALVPSLDGPSRYSLHRGVHLYELESLSAGWVRKGERYTAFPLQAIRAAFDEFEPDVVHLNDHYPLSWMVYAEAARRGIAVMGTNHFLPENLAPFLPFYGWMPKIVDWVLWRWMLALYNRFQWVTTQSQASSSIVKENGLQPNVTTISCGVDLQQFFPIPNFDRTAVRQQYHLLPDTHVMIFVGRLDREKRLETLIYAIQKLNRPDVQLVIAGKGKELQHLKELAEKHCLPGQVVFPGFVPQSELNPLLNCGDCFMMPSDAELLSIATLEAMASGLPVLAARAYALPELVSDGINGFLFTPQDASDLAEKMAKLLDHPGFQTSMRTMSIERAGKHDLNQVMNQMIRLYGFIGKNTSLQKIPNRSFKHKVSN